MTQLSTALNNSLSGLSLAARMTQTISNNVANSLTEGYAAREVQPTARTVGGEGSGVMVGAIVRSVDPVLLMDRRAAEAEYASVSVRSDFYQSIEAQIGLPDDVGALSSQVSDFSRSLIEAATSPSSESGLQAALNSAQALVAKITGTSDALQTMRVRADKDIGDAVDFINVTLEQISDVNIPLASDVAQSEEALNLADQRQTLIDRLSEYIPVKQLPKGDGTFMLYTSGGEILLDSEPAVLEFTRTGVVDASMSLSGGQLSGLSVNGQVVSTAVDDGKVAGGRLAALFDVRDIQAPKVQSQLDSFARDLIERFQDPTIDPTLGPTDAGIFTDAGGAFDPLNETGVSARITVNPLVDPVQGGDLWRLRDGLGAAAPGAAGDATLLSALSNALAEARVPSSGSFTTAMSSVSFSSEITQGVAVSDNQFSSQLTFSAARLDTLKAAELKNGVDSDQEMQRLLLVEQAYQANARVISTIDELLQTLLSI